MKNIQSITLYENSREEQLPGFDAKFPYIATCAQLDKYAVPWHWHPAAELFFIESGTLEYITPRARFIFPAGSGGYVNPNVLHASNICSCADATIQRLHLFDPVLLSGGHNNRIEEKYILPLTTSPVEILAFMPEDPATHALLEQIQQIFQLSQDAWGYEVHLRASLMQVWLQMYELARPVIESSYRRYTADAHVKSMMVYIHEHYTEPLCVQQLADLVHISKRTCFRLFQETLHISPLEYIRNYRLQKACQLLTETTASVTDIAYSCGLGSSSYFGKVFREAFGYTPIEFRKLARS